MGELIIRMVFSLAVVVGLLILISRVAARRFQGRTGSTIEVLHRQSLSKSSSVAVVSVAGRVLVLGTTEQQVNVLTELDPTALDEEQPVGEVLAEEEWDGDLEDPAYGEPLTVPSLEALLAEPDLVTLEELFGHRPPATAAAPSFDTTPAPAYAVTPAVAAVAAAPQEEDPILPEDPSYAAFASQLRAQLASGSHADPLAPVQPVSQPVSQFGGQHAARNGRHAAPAPALELPPVVTGGARAARIQAPAPVAAPVAAPIAAPVAAPVAAQPVHTAGPSAADIAALRAALLAAQLQAAAPAPVAQQTPVRPVAEGPLAGSVLSPSTWRQAIRAVNRRAS